MLRIIPSALIAYIISLPVQYELQTEDRIGFGQGEPPPAPRPPPASRPSGSAL